MTDQQAFLAWANGKGYDTAHTYDTDRSRWVWFSAMTGDLWEAWQAATAREGQRMAESIMYSMRPTIATRSPVTPKEAP